MKVYRVGIIGAGFMGRTHALCWQSLPFFYAGLPYRCLLHGVSTSRPDTAKAACESLGFARAYPSASEMIHDSEIEIVDIASPNHLHVDALREAYAAHKPAYCDKPLTGNLEQAEGLERDLGDLSRAGQMVFNYRFFPATMRARQIVEAGDLGDPICFRVAYLHSGNVAPGKRMSWKDRKDFGAGVLYDLGAHAVDLLTWLCGQPVSEVYARQRTLHPLRPSLEDPSRMVEQEADDYTSMSVVLAGGAMGTVEASKIATGAQDELRFEVHGTKGAVRFNLMDPNYLDWFQQADPEQPLGGTSGFKRVHCVQRYPEPAAFPTPKATIGWLRGHLQCLFHFIDCHHRGLPFDPSILRGVEVERMLAAAARSAAAGTPITV